MQRDMKRVIALDVDSSNSLFVPKEASSSARPAVLPFRSPGVSCLQNVLIIAPFVDDVEDRDLVKVARFLSSVPF